MAASVGFQVGSVAPACLGSGESLFALCSDSLSEKLDLTGVRRAQGRVTEEREGWGERAHPIGKARLKK